MADRAIAVWPALLLKFTLAPSDLSVYEALESFTVFIDANVGVDLAALVLAVGGMEDHRLLRKPGQFLAKVIPSSHYCVCRVIQFTTPSKISVEYEFPVLILTK